MEKFYCDHCRLLYDEIKVCKKCGSAVENKIWIEVQKQSDEQ